MALSQGIDWADALLFRETHGNQLCEKLFLSHHPAHRHRASGQTGGRNTAGKHPLPCMAEVPA